MRGQIRRALQGGARQPVLPPVPRARACAPSGVPSGARNSRDRAGDQGEGW